MLSRPYEVTKADEDCLLDGGGVVAGDAGLFAGVSRNSGGVMGTDWLTVCSKVGVGIFSRSITSGTGVKGGVWGAVRSCKVGLDDVEEPGASTSCRSNCEPFNKLGALW